MVPSIRGKGYVDQQKADRRTNSGFYAILEFSKEEGGGVVENVYELFDCI